MFLGSACGGAEPRMHIYDDDGDDDTDRGAASPMDVRVRGEHRRRA